MSTHCFVLSSLADWGFTLIGLPVTVALAAVAVIGYLFGQRTRTHIQNERANRRQRELGRATQIAWQLESIVETLRKDLAVHHSLVGGFKRRIRSAKEGNNENCWELLCAEAEAILGPTMELAHQLSHAYDQIRQQSDALETFTHGRIDPLTGVGNGRALEQQLRVLLSAAARGTTGFVVTLVSLDRQPKGNEPTTLATVLSTLPRLADVIRTCMRDTDFAARYGDEEFVVVMPQTTPAGASVFGDRLRRRVTEELSTTICCGMTEAIAADDAKSLLARADSALYSARAAGPNRLFIHSDGHIREHIAETFPPVSEAEPKFCPMPIELPAIDVAVSAGV